VPATTKSRSSSLINMITCINDGPFYSKILLLHSFQICHDNVKMISVYLFFLFFVVTCCDSM
jgi:hypothetical protein